MKIYFNVWAYRRSENSNDNKPIIQDLGKDEAFDWDKYRSFMIPDIYLEEDWNLKFLKETIIGDENNIWGTNTEDELDVLVKYKTFTSLFKWLDNHNIESIIQDKFFKEYKQPVSLYIAFQYPLSNFNLLADKV